MLMLTVGTQDKSDDCACEVVIPTFHTMVYEKLTPNQSVERETSFQLEYMFYYSSLSRM